MRSTRFLFGMIMAAAAAAVAAQDVKAYLQQYSRDVKPIEFAAGMQEFGMASRLSNAVFKPAGAGPFPVVVLGHACGGVDRPHIRERMREFLAAGYAVMALDSFGPRGLQNCRGQTAVRSPATVMDAYRALEHLSGLPGVDSKRIFFVGYSWGGVVAPQLASPQSAEVFNAKQRYRALVSYYGGCSYHLAPPAPAVEYMLPDTDQPILMLMAGRDKEFDAKECVARLESMKAAGKPVSWHVYPETHHAWDQSDQRGREVIRTPTGESNQYLYDAAATADSTRRTIEYLDGFH
jgi:dienelactone hydrolase